MAAAVAGECEPVAYGPFNESRAKGSPPWGHFQRPASGTAYPGGLSVITQGEDGCLLEIKDYGSFHSGERKPVDGQSNTWVRTYNDGGKGAFPAADAEAYLR